MEVCKGAFHAWCHVISYTSHVFDVATSIVPIRKSRRLGRQIKGSNFGYSEPNRSQTNKACIRAYAST